MTYHYTVWWNNYCANPQRDKKNWCRQFRERFRMPYDSYLDLVEKCKRSNIFKKWLPQNLHCYNKKLPVPIVLLVLCVLRYLGRGWMADDLYEATTINRETIRQFIHAFIRFGSTVLYNTYVCEPLSKEQLDDCAFEFNQAGLPGAIGSTDATHVIIERCLYKLR